MRLYRISLAILAFCIVCTAITIQTLKKAVAATQSQTMTYSNLNFKQPYNTGYLAIPAFSNLETMDIEAVDLDNDGCKDVALTTLYNKPSKIFWNNCDGTWTETTPFVTSSSWGIASADFNNDGYMDLAIGNYGGGFGGTSQNYLYINNRNRTFTTQAQFGNGNTTNLQIQDLNNDGRPDVVVPNAGQSYTYTNNGNGTFTASPLLTPINTMNLKLFDLDKDSDLDALKSEYSGWSSYNIKNASGTWTTYNVTNTTVSDMQPIDFDKDGDWDFTVANVGQNYLYVNNGDGTWTRRNEFGLLSTNETVIIDLDGNGYDDVVVANGAWGGSQQNYVYYNNGNGTFTAVAKFGAGSTYNIKFSDIDNDGDLDALIGNWGQDYIYLNGYYATSTTNFSLPIRPTSYVTGWNSISLDETINARNSILYSVYSADDDYDNSCTDETLLKSATSSTSGQLDISGLTGQELCVYAQLSTLNPSTSPQLKNLTVNFLTTDTASSSVIPSTGHLGQTQEVRVNYFSPRTLYTGQRVQFVWDSIMGTSLTSCATPTTDVNELSPGGTGVEIFNNGTYDFVFSTSTQPGVLTFCMKLSSLNNVGSFFVSTSDSNGFISGFLYYVGNNVMTDNQIFVKSTIAPTLSFNIRTLDDSADTNLCDFGTVDTAFLIPDYDDIIDQNFSECGYGLAIGTNAYGGFITQISSDGPLRTNNSNIFNIPLGNIFTMGIESYGIVHVEVATSGRNTTTKAYTESLVKKGIFSNSFGIPVPILPTDFIEYGNGVEYVGDGDAKDLTKVIHGLVISAGTPAGSYKQVVTYITTARF